MAISYPLAFPTVTGLEDVEIMPHSSVGMSRSEFTGAQQTYDWGGAWWEARVSLPPMKRASAEEWIAFLISLNGLEGSFLMGEPLNTSPRGSWAGTPVVKGAHAVRAETIAVDGFTPSTANVLRKGDWLQFGTGSGSRLHKSRTDVDADGSGEASIEIWPPLRAALSDNASIVVSSPKGLFMLSENVNSYSIGRAQMYGLSFACMEDLRDI